VGANKLITSAYNTQGASFWVKGNFPKALEYILKALKIAEETGDKKTMAINYNNIGIIYQHRGDVSKALEYFLKDLKMSEEIGNIKGTAGTLNNIGVIYKRQNELSKALEYYHRALKITEEFGVKKIMADTYVNMGIVYDEQGDQSTDLSVSQESYSKALEYYYQSLKIREELGDKNGMANSYLNIGISYTTLNKTDEADKYLNKGLEIGKRIGSLILEKHAYEYLAELYEKQKKYKKAYEYYHLYSDVKDSLFNEESSRQIAEMQEKYESEKSEKEIELLNKDKALQQAELQKQTLQKYAVGLVLVITLFFAVFIYRSYRQKKKDNVLLADQKKIIVEKNKDITDSIRYAERIQNAILPTTVQMEKLLPESFVFFKPKDIVSGDFYWVGQQDGKTLVAACDCTGHGVPGAFMSMIGNALFNEVVNERGITDPGEVLDQVRQGIINSLKQTGELGEQKDGMDAAICLLDLKNRKLDYAGAYNPLWLIRRGELKETKGDKQPVGYYEERAKSYTTHSIELEQGDAFYLFSDGFQDQFGGPKGKKFMAKRMKQLLVEMQDKSMPEQQAHLDKTIEQWKGSGEQVDDILVIGIRI